MPDHPPIELSDPKEFSSESQLLGPQGLEELSKLLADEWVEEPSE